MSTAAPPSISIKELYELCALDSSFYCRTFFPQTFRQKSPPFHQDIWNLLEDQNHRHVAIEIFRGGAKTTLLRAYVSKRIAYGISRTIGLVSEAQDHSKKSLSWIKTQVERNVLWRDVYKISKGRKWTDDEIELRHGILGIPITVVALGITGQVRGINVEDYRPDLWVVDDPCDEENTGTPEQRTKISELFFGALDKGLTPATECPDAKMVLLQTSLNEDDLVNNCHRDPRWASRKYGCFDENGVSRWPDRYPTETLLEDKRSHISRGQLSLWMREMECSIVAGEASDLRSDWLQTFEPYQLEGIPLSIHLSIDPVPPPSDRETAVGFAKKDYEVIQVWGAGKGNYYGLDQARSHGHTPEWTISNVFRLIDKWNPLKIRVEGVAYQRTLKWILEQEMAKRGRYLQVDAVTDKRPKRHRIIQAFSGPGSAKRLFVPTDWYAFREQFASYPNCRIDDDLDCGAMCLDSINQMRIGTAYEECLLAQQSEEPLPNWRQAP